MERIPLIRKERNKKREKEILGLLKVNSSGMVIYPGKGRESERTGSPAIMLILYYLYKNGTKPLDYDLFCTLI